MVFTSTVTCISRTVAFVIPSAMTDRVSAADQKTAAIDLGSKLELFVDYYLIDRLEDACLKLHSPQPAEVVLRFNRPWEGGNSAYFTIIKDDETYRMYYRGSPIAPGQAQVTCYAESSDGVRWTRPNLGLFDVQGIRRNNVILTPEVAGTATHNFCPFIDKKPGTPSAERFKAVGGGSSGLVPFVSADGKRWQQLRDEPVITKGAFDSQNVAFWSESEECYVCYFRIFVTGVRSIARTTSNDFLHWSEPVPMDFGKTPLEHLYTNATHPYFRAPHIYIALPRRFMPGRRVLTDTQVQEIDLENAANYRGLKDDCSEGVFMTSRGGTQYHRSFLEGFIRPGLDLRNWTSRSNNPALGVVPTAPSEMSLYVKRHKGQRTAHLQRFTLRTDGFVSVNAPYSGGEMVTRPLTFTGEQLILNVATSAAGGAHVGIEEETGEPIEGYSIGDCPEIIGDQINRVVVWKRGRDVSPLAGRRVRLRFVMKDADLYSLRFQ